MKKFVFFATIGIALVVILSGTASAGHIVLPVVDGVVRDGLDSPKDGIADVIMANVVVQVLDVERDIMPFEDRGILEFDLSTLSGPITSATLDLNVFSSNGPYPFNVDVFTYTGDGILSLNDFNVGTLFHTFGYSGEKTVQLDATPFIKTIVSSGDQYAGFNLQFAEPSTIPMNGPFVAFNSLEYPPAATLTILAVPEFTTIDIEPDTLNLKSKGKWITAYIELPDGYDVNNIDVSTVMLEDQVQTEARPTEIGDYDNDDIADLMVKFDRQKLISLLEVGDAELTVAGELCDGTPFEGSDTIRVID